MSENVIDILENVSPETWDEILDNEEKLESWGYPCAIIRWFSGSLRQYRALVDRLMRNHITVHVIDDFGRSKYMVVVRDDGFLELAAFI